MYGYGNSMFLATHGILARTASGGGIDPDAQAFITAAAITDPTQQAAINQLVVDLKGYNIWTKFKAIYPIVGGVASSHAVNLKTPGTFNLTFATGWTHASTGMTPNGATYADTALNPSSALTLNSTHLSFYSRTNVSAVQRDIAIYQNGDNPVIALGTNVGTEISDHYNYNQRISASIASSTGFYIGSRTSSTSHKLYKNNTTLGTNTSANVNILPNGNVFIGGSNSGIYGITAYSTKQCAFASIGDGLTDAEAANFYTAVQAYQTTLGRSIGTQTVSDADAQAFINAANIVDQVEATAINNLVIGLKADSLWTKMKAIYPIVGGTAASHKWNLKDPRDLDAAFRLTFATGYTHSATGMLPNGSSAYADTFYNPSVNGSINNVGASVYLRTNVTGDRAAFGVLDNFFNGIGILPKWSDNNTYYGANDNIGTGAANIVTDTRGLFLTNRIAAGTKKLFKNGSVISTATPTSNSLPNYKLVYSARNYFGSIQNYDTREIAFASIGDGLTDTDAANLNTRVNTYQVALSRNV